MQEIAFSGKLATPAQIRELQRRLYRKAKQDTAYRFYSLYDKVYRADLLRQAYVLVRANKGAPGMDGVTFEAIEGDEGGVDQFLSDLAEELRTKQYRPAPVRRVFIPKGHGSSRPLGIPTIRDRVVQAAVKVLLEPIFEADFVEFSYGFRPKRSAHQAIADVTRNVLKGRTVVWDCDLAQYFDSIPHDHLLQVVARRIVDKHILRLINQWLKAPVVVERGNEKRTWEGGRRRTRGTPQGGVLSPLLANVYLHELDQHWRAHQLERRLNARLVRYADDLVVICRDQTESAREEVCRVLTRLGLTLNDEKTQRVDLWQEAVTFLGFEIRMQRSPRTGRAFPMVYPSKKALVGIRQAIKERTTRQQACHPPAMVIADLNQQVRGWVQYFHYGHCTQAFNKLRRYVADRVRLYLHRRRGQRLWGYHRYPDRLLHEQYGLFAIPRTAPWKRVPVHARR